jgi:hypothetical protein
MLCLKLLPPPKFKYFWFGTVSGDRSITLPTGLALTLLSLATLRSLEGQIFVPPEDVAPNSAMPLLQNEPFIGDALVEKADNGTTLCWDAQESIRLEETPTVPSRRSELADEHGWIPTLSCIHSTRPCCSK